ncbi:hypothetical protein KFL_007120090 [Klebsormidium nitens]|uniref:Uncharacterized protein n=1 Tax=Klebsormidium nitens TaxID=105231 RepID=A0A1Y1IJD8_KLENI|nr:hypothetical protein KFL_007120090 [Klebsormidium nitens]|eukprot:GAQ91005.1 hypothetical protein KFL_007120090 [Klebsormidium nitens]
MLFRDLVEKYNLGEPGVDLTCGCADVVNSVLADGVACARLQDLALDGTYNKQRTTIKPIGLTARPETGWYKIVCVMGTEANGDADFHFVRQDIMDMYDLYSITLHGYHDFNRPQSCFWFGTPLWQGGKGGFFTTTPSPYDVLGIHPFTGSRYVESIFTDTSRDPSAYGLKGNLRAAHSYISGAKPIDQNDPNLNRPRTNIDLHVSRIPEYILSGKNFIPSPFWLVSVDPFVEDCANKVRRRQQELSRIYEGRPGYELHKKTVDDAAKDCIDICNKRRGMPPVHSLIGTFSEKLGFGTGALNTDGAFKLNFDPSKACRYRGGVHYQSVCTAFSVLHNHGVTAISAFDRPSGRKTKNATRQHTVDGLEMQDLAVVGDSGPPHWDGDEPGRTLDHL